MDNEQRARELAKRIAEWFNESQVVAETMTRNILVAAFAEVKSDTPPEPALVAARRGAFEMAANLCRDKARALAALALFGDNAHARRREGMEAAYKNAEHLIRALSFEQSGISSPINTTGATQSSIEYQQQRGVAWDIIDQAINTYEQWMLDDDYDATRVLDEIIDNLRKRRALYRSPESVPTDPRKALATALNTLRDICDVYVARSELFTNEDDLALNLHDRAVKALRLAENGG